MARKSKKAKKIDHAPPGSRVKIRFGKHILPPLAGLAVAVSVFGFFNSQLISGRIAYYMYARQAVVENLDTTLEAEKIDKNAPPQIIINKYFVIKLELIQQSENKLIITFCPPLTATMTKDYNVTSLAWYGGVGIVNHSVLKSFQKI